MTTRPEPGSSLTVTPAAPPAEALIGKRVHQYEVVRVIGRGGMGTVYEGLNTAIGKRVAMKFIDAATAQNVDAVARFQREAQAASAVESDHIVEIFDSGISEEGLPYIVMELLRGEDLGHRIRRCGRIDVPEAIHVTAQILRGLHRAHKAGIVHRDLKPDNIFLVDRDDNPNFAKILDFGISKVRRRGETPVHTLTRQGTVLGTPFYMSPEQAQAQPDVDARSDLWSVGAILYECLTGRPPYTGATYEQVIVNICMNDADDVRVYNPGVPEPIANVIARALQRDRDDRFGDAREFLDALRAGSAGLVVSHASPQGGEDSLPGVSSTDPGAAPIRSGYTPSTGNGRRPRSATSDPALDATVKFRSTPPLDKRGAVQPAHGPAANGGRQRTFVLVAVGALLLGGFGAFLLVRGLRSTEGQPNRAPSSALAIPPPPVPTSEPLIAPELTASAPAAEPTPPPADSAEVKSKIQKPVHGGATLAAPPPSSVKTVPRSPDTATPATSGVASGLKLKTD